MNKTDLHYHAVKHGVCHDGKRVERELVREAANRYDRQAVRVEWRGHKLGYVPLRDNTAVSQMLDRGQRLRAGITQLNSDAGPWGRLKMAIIAE